VATPGRCTGGLVGQLDRFRRLVLRPLRAGVPLPGDFRVGYLPSWRLRRRIVRGRCRSIAYPYRAGRSGRRFERQKAVEKANPMPNTSSPQLSKLLPLSLVFLLTGLLGCSHGSLGEQQAAGAKAAAPAATPGTKSPTPAAAAPASASPAAAPAPAPSGAAGGNIGTPAAHSPAAPGAPSPATAAAQQALPPDKIPAVVAKVNGAPIAKDELLKTADQVHSQMPGLTTTADFYRRVLDNLVSRELLLQEAKASGITATDDEINKQIAELKGRFPSPEKFQEELKKEKMTETELTQRARDAFIVQKLVETKVVNGVKVTDQEIKEFYDKNQDQMKRPERVHVRHILIRVEKGATAETRQKARAKADDLLVKAKGGADFAKLATENSDDPGSKQRGGDLSWVARGQTVPPFEAAAFALKKPNDFSPVVETEYGYHVIQLVAHEDAGLVPFAEVKDRIAEFLKQQQQQTKVQDHLKALKEKAKLELFI
jgi:peptidyl-prolyl cis-trans isomerase C